MKQPRKRGKVRPRQGRWRKWDLLQFALTKHKERYVKAAFKEAYKIFGKQMIEPPFRMGVHEWLDPKFEMTLGMLEYEPVRPLRAGKGKR